VKSRAANRPPEQSPAVPSTRIVGLLAAALALLPSADARAGLVDFARQRDPATRWEVVSRRAAERDARIDARLVSGTWRGRPWQHGLRLTRPARLAHDDVAVLVIGGDETRSFIDESRLACDAGVVVALLRNVPNQPSFGRSEDDLVAYSFEQYLRTGDAEWPVLLPMSRAALRAMDAISDLAAREWGLNIRRYVVTGASKRGWTSWLAAIADARVAAIAPVVFDNLNISAQLANQQAVWGRYSADLDDYVQRDLPRFVDTDRGRSLLATVDPYAYRGALSGVAKLLVNGTNDPYWELGAVNLYWGDIPGAKSLLEVPNAGHGAGADSRVPATLAAFVGRVAGRRAMPELHWLHGGADGEIAVGSSEPPLAVSFWRADSPSRDFRSARWRHVGARLKAEGFVPDAAPPEAAFAAIFAEAQYPEPHGTFMLSTPVRITPAPAHRASRSSAASRAAPLGHSSRSSQ
jgi:PhoPQ-activated pathogenicity-related protein